MNLPIYDAIIENSADGIINVSLVECPATEVDFILFSKDEKQLQFADEEQRMLTAPLMLADTPIYRNDNGFEYYIKYTKETLKLMAEKALKENALNRIDVDHKFDELSTGKVSIVELYIKDENKKSPFDIPDGSLVITYKIHDDEIWNMCKEGVWKGLSLAGTFGVEEQFEKQKKNNTMNTIKNYLRNLLAQFGEVETSNGVLEYVGDELAVGVEVSVGGEVAADGEYQTEDKVIVVKDGVVAEIKDKEDKAEEEAVAEEMTEEMAEETPVVEEEPVEEDKTAEDIEALKAIVEELKAEVENIKAVLAEPAAEPIAEEFSMVEEKSKENDYFAIMRNARK